MDKRIESTYYLIHCEYGIVNKTNRLRDITRFYNWLYKNGVNPDSFTVEQEIIFTQSNKSDITQEFIRR